MLHAAETTRKLGLVNNHLANTTKMHFSAMQSPRFSVSGYCDTKFKFKGSFHSLSAHYIKIVTTIISISTFTRLPVANDAKYILNYFHVIQLAQTKTLHAHSSTYISMHTLFFQLNSKIKVLFLFLCRIPQNPVWCFPTAEFSNYLCIATEQINFAASSKHLLSVLIFKISHCNVMGSVHD